MSLVVFTLAAGCAKLKPTQTGYLSSYDFCTVRTNATLIPLPDTLAGIDSFQIQDLAWRVPDAKGFDEIQQQAIIDTLRNAVTREFAILRPVVDTAGPHTALIRMAITDATRADVGLNAISSLLIGPLSNGGASVEGEVLAPDGRQLAAISDGKNGSPFQFLGFYSQKSHAQSAASAIARALAATLDPTFEAKRSAALSKASAK